MIHAVRNGTRLQARATHERGEDCLALKTLCARRSRGSLMQLVAAARGATRGVNGALDTISLAESRRKTSPVFFPESMRSGVRLRARCRLRARAATSRIIRDCYATALSFRAKDVPLGR